MLRSHRILSVLLVLVLLIGSLAACAKPNNETKDPTTAPEEKTGPVWLDHLPEKNLNQEEICFAYFGNADNSKSACSVILDERNGDSVDTTLYERNRTVEQRFGVVLTNHLVDTSFLSNSIKPALSSGVTDYDVLVGYQYYDVALAAEGFLDDLNMYDNTLDLSASYWAGDYIRNINYGDKTYWITGDATLNFIGNICCCFVNSELYKNHALKDYGNIYDIVREHEWTLETMSEMASAAYIDLNANDRSDDGDQYGYEISWGVEMAFAAGVNTSTIDDKGNVEITINNDTTVDVIQWLNEISEAEYTGSYPTEELQVSCFVEGRTLIYCRCLSTTEFAAFRNMETDYYILPLPMGDDTMDDYRSATATGTNIIGISYCSEKKKDAALVLEALCAESARTVIPEYYDHALKDKYSRDKDSAEMIELIHDRVSVDFVNTWSLYGFDSYVFYLTFDADTVASRIQTSEEKWNILLTQLLEKLDSLD